MEKCNLCPRRCGVNRLNTSGYCGTKKLKIAYVMMHKWEEPLISGEVRVGAGSGAIFFSGCNLKCVYCQNKEISGGARGKEVSPQELANIFKELEKDGANNINLVTPTHFASEIIESLKIYKPSIPVVWNTSGYESIETIDKLKGYVDIFLTDLKYYTEESAHKYSKAPNYFEVASKSLIKMREIAGKDIIENGLMKKGIIVRHLIIPGLSGESVKILNWIKQNLGAHTIISLMSQFTPNGELKNYPEINKKLTNIEYNRVVSKARELGFYNAFIQDLDSSSEEYIPHFLEKSKYI